MQAIANRYEAAMAQSDPYAQSRALGELFNDVGQAAVGVGYTGASLGRPAAAVIDVIGENAFMGPRPGSAWAQRGAVGIAEGAGAAANGPQFINISRGQLQHAFKHAEDFGVAGNANNVTLAEFNAAIQNHVNGTNTQVIQGTYRGQPVTHFVDSATGLNVIRDSSNNFLSGWRLNSAQLMNIN